MILLLIWLALAGAADAETWNPATTYDGAPARWRVWDLRSESPSPPGRVRVAYDAATWCPGGSPACVGREDQTIHVRRDSARNRHLWAHELGHVYDMRAMDVPERLTFMRLIGMPGRGWTAPIKSDARDIFSVEEMFADVYAACSHQAVRSWYLTRGRYYLFDGYRPTWSQLREVCRFIRSTR
jgi:hypothetical protein